MSDGLLGKCKTCAKQDVKNHRLENIEKIRAYDRDRGKQAKRIALAAEMTKRWRSEDLRRQKSHSAVAKAIRNGLLHKAPCVICGDEKSEAHHESYDAPLDVVWYCKKHHKARHKEMVLKNINP